MAIYYTPMVKILNRKHAPAATFLHLGTFFDLKPQNRIILQRHGKGRIGWCKVKYDVVDSFSKLMDVVRLKTAARPCIISSSLCPSYQFPL
jgi:hypothetical protein